VPAILLLRHAQASFGTENYDRLSELGRRQAVLLGAALKERAPNLASVVAGTSVRQRHTAELALPGSELPLLTDARLEEYPIDQLLAHHGPSDVSLERPGMTSREFQGVLDSTLSAWVEAGPGTGAELSWPDFQSRCTVALGEVAATLQGGESAVVFTSGGVIAAIAASLLGRSGAEFPSLNRVILNASLTKVVFGGSGATLISFNEHAHLEAAGAGMLTYR
jgi:broad specificity phosphatase PhoE